MCKFGGVIGAEMWYIYAPKSTIVSPRECVFDGICIEISCIIGPGDLERK